MNEENDLVENLEDDLTPEVGGFDLFELLAIFGTKLDPQKCKFHFAKSKLQKHIDGFSARSSFKEFQEYQTARNFKREFIVSFYLQNGFWMFAGVWKSLSVEEVLRPNKKSHFRYTTEFVSSSTPLERRLIVKWFDRFRHSYPTGEKLAKGLHLHSILELPDTLGHFPGYASIKLSLSAIKRVVENPGLSTEWRTALESVPGVYVISDISNGHLYVGSATGSSGIWQRWVNYANTGHGGDIELIELVKNNGDQYPFDNFIFSLLWYGGTAASDEEVFVKESFWKIALLSREFGNYNAN